MSTANTLTGPKTAYLPPINREAERGLLLTQSVYDESGNLQRKITNEYDFDYTPVEITGLRVNFSCFFNGYHIYVDTNCASKPTLWWCEWGQAYYDEHPYSFDWFFTPVPRTPMDINNQPEGYLGFYVQYAEIWTPLLIKTEEIYDQNNPSQKITRNTEYQYSPYNLKPSQIIRERSDGRYENTVLTYPDNYHDPGNSNNSGVYGLKSGALHVNEAIVEKVTYLNDQYGNNNEIISGEISQFDESDHGLPSYFYVLETDAPVALADFKFSNVASAGTVPAGSDSSQAFGMDSHYKLHHTLLYTATDRVHWSSETSGAEHEIFWGQYDNYPIARVKYAGGSSDAAYTSFEGGDNEGNWTYGSGTYDVYETGGVSGGFSFKGSLTSDPLAGSYKLSFWAKIENDNGDGVPEVHVNVSDGTTITYSNVGVSGTGWKYYEVPLNDLYGQTVTVASPATTSNEVPVIYLDEVRLEPTDAFMTTYTYHPFGGVSSVSDENGKLMITEYDELYRKQTVKDQDGNIHSLYRYHYKQ